MLQECSFVNQNQKKILTFNSVIGPPCIAMVMFIDTISIIILSKIPINGIVDSQYRLLTSTYMTMGTNICFFFIKLVVEIARCCNMMMRHLVISTNTYERNIIAVQFKVRNIKERNATCKHIIYQRYKLCIHCSSRKYLFLSLKTYDTASFKEK